MVREEVLLEVLCDQDHLEVRGVPHVDDAGDSICVQVRTAIRSCDEHHRATNDVSHAPTAPAMQQNLRHALSRFDQESHSVHGR
jgi:hypothetical protein